ncbi:MAG: hypothetical protein R2757_19235 [Draconibacterium sp.]
MNKKGSPEGNWKEIPPLIEYIKEGERYSILTDVSEVEKPDDLTSDENTSVKEGDGIDRFKSLSHNEQKAILFAAIKENSSKWMKIYENVQSILVGQKKIEGKPQNYYAVVFNVNLKGDSDVVHSQIPDYLVYTYQNKEYNLPTDINQVGNVSLTLAGNKVPVVLNNNFCPGCSIGVADPDSTGTLGLFVKKEDEAYKDKTFLLSCYHVLCPSEFATKVGSYKANVANGRAVLAPGKVDGNSQPIATLIEGAFSNKIDAAIALVNEGVLIDTKPWRLNPVNPSVRSQYSLEHGHRVRFTGRSSGQMDGTIESYWGSVNLKSENCSFEEIIITSKISTKGDSGGCVYDENDRPIGILFADDESYSYLIPIQTIFDTLKIKL